MAGFVGRKSEIALLRRHLGKVRRGTGVFLSVRGRRQVGKSRLLEEFLAQAGVPSVFFAATRGAAKEEELRFFVEEVAASTLEVAPLFAGASFDRWESALRLIGAQATRPSVVVLDELPYLLAGDPSLEGALQKTWDRYLSPSPVLLVGVGSDLSTMEMLGRYDRPLYQRMLEMVVDPLTVADVAEMVQLSAPNAFDATLVTGGFPKLVATWGRARSLKAFLNEQLSESTSPLVVVGERIVNAEFPSGLQARDVLGVIGAGTRTFATIGARSGLNQGSLTRTLSSLVEKRVVAVDRPLAGESSRNALYRVADPYLRFWLRFVSPAMEELLRGRGPAVKDRILQHWEEYRGRAVEPLVRASVERLLPDARFGHARCVGSWWTRTGNIEVDLVGARDPQAPTEVAFVGSIKWRERAPFDRRDLTHLAASRLRVPGAEDARLVGVARAGFSTTELDVALGPNDLVAAWG